MARHIHTNPFTGEGSFGSLNTSTSSYNFIKNDYTVFPEGLNGEEPNPYAKNQAEYVKSTMSFQSENKLTGLDYLYYFIEDLAKKERKRELALIKGELAMLQKQKKDSFFKSTHTVKALNEIVKALETEPNYDTWRTDESISSAFTLLFSSLGYDEIQRELESEKNTRGVQAMNDFWEGLNCRDIFNEVYPNFEKEFRHFFTVQAGDKLFTNGSKNLINDLIDRFVNTFANGFSQKLLKTKAEQEKYQKALVGALKRTFGNNGFYFDEQSLNSKRIRKKYSLGEEALNEEEIEDIKKFVKDRVKKSTPTGKVRDLTPVVRAMTYNSVKSILWKFAEMMPSLNQNKIAGWKLDHIGDTQVPLKSYGDVVSSTLIGKDITHPGTSTTDSIMKIEVLRANNSEVDKELNKKKKQKIANNEAFLNDIEKEVKEQKEVAEKVKQIFKVEINTKGYMKGDDLEVVNARDLNSLSGNLKDVAQSFYKLAGVSDEAYRNNRLGLMFDSLIFMLNNTIKGASFSSPEDKKMVKQLVSYICAAWMWNGMTGVMKEIDAKEASDVTHVHVFQSGGAYFTASDLLYQVLNIIKKNFTYGPTIDNANSYMTVSLSSAASFDPNVEYKKLRETYPLTTTKMSRSSFKKKQEGLNYEQRQKQLGRRWEAMRNLSMSNTKLRVNFRQEALNELLGRLSGLRSL